MSGPPPFKPNKLILTPDPKKPGGTKEYGTDAKDAKSYLWAGTIIHVDTETMVCSVRLDSGQGERHDIPLPAAGGGGPRSWAGIIPEPGTKVVLGWKKFGHRSFVPYITEFLTVGTYSAREYEPFSTVIPSEAKAALAEYPDLIDDPHVNLNVLRLKSRKGYSGDFVASSSDGSDFILDRDVYFTNRAGNEFRLRDSDQTTVLQTRNEFVSNAAGYYRRGLIKRNAFNFLPDLYPLDSKGKPATIIAKTHPAYNILLQFGLIKADGTQNFPNDPNNLLYPYMVMPDGQRISYITHGEQDQNFVDVPYGYIEDRTELRHISDGIMPVTEEGDGFQIDPPFPVFIEDVKGTVIGNDFQSDAGRPLYKRILTMRLFNNPDQATPSDGPIFEPVDLVTRLGIADDVALARLFRIVSPNGSNEYAFGVTKEGKVLIHVPKTKVGDPNEKGKSVDLNVAGLIKAIVGVDENSGNKSLDIKLQGGVSLDIGRMTDGTSIRLNLKGKITKIHNGNDAVGITNEEIYGGSTHRSVSASHLHVIGGNHIENVGAEKVVQAFSSALNAGLGGMKNNCVGDAVLTILGKTQEQYGKLHTSTYALGKNKKSISGVDSTTVLAGSITRTVIAGAGISDTVTAGGIKQTIGVGNFSTTVGAGNLTATVGAGNLALTASAGAASLTSSLVTTITAGMVAAINAPVVKIGVIVIGTAVAGVPGPPTVYLDPITGLPALGLPNITIG